MSSKETIFTTEDNEHCYYEGNDPVYEKSKFIGDTIYIEFNTKHAKLIDDNYTIEIALTDPNSEIYKLIASLKGK